MKFLDLAKELSLESTAKQQKMAAVVVRGGKILSIGINRLTRHAEARALRPHRDLKDATIYVMRSNGRISKPCPDCQKLIGAAGVKRAVYINEIGGIEVSRFDKA